MRKLSIMLWNILLASSVLLSGCAQLGLTKDNKNSAESYINGDGKALSTLIQDYQYSELNSRSNSKGIDIDFKDLTGNSDMLNLYSKEGSTATISYSSKLSSGSLRVVLINSNKEVVDVVKNSGDGTITAKLNGGRAYIKCIGNKAAGSLKIDVTLDQSPDVSGFSEDGTFVYYDCKTDGDNLTGSILRVNVVNKKAEKVAKIKLSGKIQNGRGQFKYDDDGWGNSGTVELTALPDNKVQFKVDILKRKSQNPEWEFEAGTYTSKDEPMPAYIDAL